MRLCFTRFGFVLFFLVLLCFVLVNECCLIKSVGRISAGVLRLSFYFGEKPPLNSILIPKIIQFQRPMPRRCYTHKFIFLFFCCTYFPFGLYIAGLICLLLLFIQWIQCAYVIELNLPVFFSHRTLFSSVAFLTGRTKCIHYLH